MAKKKKIDTTQTAKRVGDIEAAYQQAVAAGRGEQFLQSHPKFAAKQGGGAPASGGGGNVEGTPSDNVGERGRYDDVRKPVRDIVKADEQVEREESQAQVMWQNPTYNTAFGSSSVSYDERGNPVYAESLSPDQQQILDQGEALTQAGQQKAGQMLNSWNPYSNQQYTSQFKQFQGGQGATDKSNQLVSGYQKFDMTGNEADRNRIEDAVYSRLTRNFDRDMAKEKQDLEQTLYNRGIPLDPSNPQYKQHMDAFNEKWQGAKESAMGQAVEMGGSELQRSFGMGLQSHQQGLNDATTLYGMGQSAHQQNVNDITQRSNWDLQQHQQGMSDMASLQGYGTGLQVPNLPGYQAPNYDVASPAEIDIALRKLKLEQQAINQQGGGGGSTGGGGYEEPEPEVPSFQ